MTSSFCCGLRKVLNLTGFQREGVLELVSSTALLFEPRQFGASVSPFLRGPRLTTGTQRSTAGCKNEEHRVEKPRVCLTTQI